MNKKATVMLMLVVVLGFMIAPVVEARRYYSPRPYYRVRYVRRISRYGYSIYRYTYRYYGNSRSLVRVQHLYTYNYRSYRR